MSLATVFGIVIDLILAYLYFSQVLVVPVDRNPEPEHVERGQGENGDLDVHLYRHQDDPFETG